MALYDQTTEGFDPFSSESVDATAAFAFAPGPTSFPAEPLYGLQDVAARWGCTVVQVRSEIPAGLPFRMQPNGQYAVAESDLLAYEKKRDKKVRRGKRVSRITTGLLALVLIGVIGGMGYLLSQAWNSMSSIADGSATASRTDASPAAGNAGTAPSSASSSAGAVNASSQSTTTAAPATDVQTTTETPAVEPDAPAPAAQTPEQPPAAQQLEYHTNSENDATHTYPDYLYERQVEIPAANGGSWHVNHFYVTSTPTGAERGYVITSAGNRIDVETGSGFSMSYQGAPCYVHSSDEVANLGLAYHWYFIDSSGQEVAIL